MLERYERPSLAGMTAATVTTAAFAKMFLPFYLIGSTSIFAVTSMLGTALIVISCQPLYGMASKVTVILLCVGAFYIFVIANFLILSRPAVPMTHMFGILIFHSLFMIFGFAAARAFRTMMALLLCAAAIYAIVVIQHTIRFGDVMQGGALNDILGVGDLSLAIGFHQKIGIVLGLAALAGIGLISSRVKQILGVITLLVVLLFMFHIAARGALVALVCSLVFMMVMTLWRRSKSLTVLGLVALIVTMALASALFYQRALHDTDVDPTSPDAISRTLREIQDPDPGFRLPIWAKTWHRILAEPDRLLFGRGIGMYPVNQGVGAPDWLLQKTEGSKIYPHNIHLEMLYETGIVGLLLFSLVTLFPIVVSLKHWQSFSLAERSVVSMYVFHLVSSEFSGAFAYQYLDYFFFALTVGIIALKRTEGAAIPARPSGTRAVAGATEALVSGSAPQPTTRQES